MEYKYLYIDDELDETVEGIKRNLTTDQLKIDVRKPSSWDKQIEWLIDQKNLDSFDGLLMDLKLEFSDEDNKLKYFGPDLAQAIRTKIKEGLIKDLPILLCTTDQKLMQLFDRTSKDLFDHKFDKKKDFKNSATTLKFIAFAEGYKRINDNDTVNKVLTCDASFVHEVGVEYNKLSTTHDRSNFIFHEVVNCNGMLIEEELLSVRMGVDLKESLGWEDFKNEKLHDFIYEGVFSSAFIRWWQEPLMQWWKDTVGRSLQVLDANDRIKKIKEKIGDFDLVPLKTPKDQNYSNFWYSCQISRVPLESGDGFMTINMPKYVWQEPTFIAMNYVMSDDRDAEHIKKMLGSSELKRFEEILTKQREV